MLCCVVLCSVDVLYSLFLPSFHKIDGYCDADYNNHQTTPDSDEVIVLCKKKRKAQYYAHYQLEKICNQQAFGLQVYVCVFLFVIKIVLKKDCVKKKIVVKKIVVKRIVSKRLC